MGLRTSAFILLCKSENRMKTGSRNTLNRNILISKMWFYEFCRGLPSPWFLLSLFISVLLVTVSAFQPPQYTLCISITEYNEPWGPGFYFFITSCTTEFKLLLSYRCEVYVMTLFVHLSISDLFTSHKNFNSLHIFKDTKRKKTCQKKNEVLLLHKYLWLGPDERSLTEGKPNETQIPKLEAAHVLGSAGSPVKQLSRLDLPLNHQIGRQMDTMSSETSRG